MSSVRPIQKLCSLASMRRVVGSALTIVQLIFFAVASATGNAFSGASASDNGARSDTRAFAGRAVSAPASGRRGYQSLRFAQPDVSRDRTPGGCRCPVVDVVEVGAHAARQGTMMRGDIGGQPHARCRGEGREPEFRAQPIAERPEGAGKVAEGERQNITAAVPKNAPIGQIRRLRAETRAATRPTQPTGTRAGARHHDNSKQQVRGQLAGEHASCQPHRRSLAMLMTVPPFAEPDRLPKKRRPGWLRVT